MPGNAETFFASILSGLGKAGSHGISPENWGIHTHNLKVIGSNPIPATNKKTRCAKALAGFFMRRCALFAAQSRSQKLAAKSIAYHRVLRSVRFSMSHGWHITVVDPFWSRRTKRALRYAE